MAIFFGTDGIRGIVNSELTNSLATSCGNALSTLKPKCKIIIGRDTRLSGDYLTCAFSSGAMAGGGNVIDIGICPTPAIAYLTKYLNADFGVVISASHNKMEYNGIKIFDENGLKLGDEREENLERKFVESTLFPTHKLGSFKQDFKKTKYYINHLKQCSNTSLKGLKVVLDASNGALYKIAPYVFKSLGANVITTNCKNDGININENCGSLFPQNLIKKVLQTKADMGFSFDGDGDRIIACDEKGNLIDGDQILYILAKYKKENNTLNKPFVVGTHHTNMGIEEALKNIGITLLRADIGDKYVSQKMEELNLNLGGEKSGHIILRDYASSGDGLLIALMLAKICKELNKKISGLTNISLYEQTNIDFITKDKMRLINSEQLLKEIENQKTIYPNSRILVRVSGTEPKIRIMAESKSKEISNKIAKNIENVLKTL